MTLEEARATLGIPAEETSEEAVKRLAEARERLAEMVRMAPTEKLGDQFQAELVSFDKALAALREDAERRRQEKMAGMMALVPGAVTGTVVKSKREGFLDEPSPPKVVKSQTISSPVSATVPTPPRAAEEEETFSESHGAAVVPSSEVDEDAVAEREVVKSGSGGRFFAWAFLFLVIGGAGGGWLYFKQEEQRRLEVTRDMLTLERLGANLVANRRWEEATQVYLRMEELVPESEQARVGRASIEAGRREEQEQFVGYWSGASQAAFEAGRLDEALEAADKVLERYPEDAEVHALKGQIVAARREAVRSQLSTQVRAAVEKKDWEAAEAGVAELANRVPEDEMISVLAKEIAAGREQARIDHERAKELANSARLRDAGKFDPLVLEWMREAVALAPDDAEIRELYDRVASYTRTIHVPGEVATLGDALKGARAKDRIVLAAGTFEAGVVIDLPVELEGAGLEETVLESHATDAPTLTFGPGATGTVIRGLSFRSTGFDVAELRFPGVQVRGGEVEFSGCAFRDASGNGLEVIDGGLAKASKCLFENNGWDGFAARGKGSRMEALECRSMGNFAHGFEIWDGASARILKSVARENTRNGILVDSVADDLEVVGNQLRGNREYGLLLNAGAAGKVADNACRGNQLGGLLVRFAAMSVIVEGNTIENNEGSGLILEQGLRADTYESNQLRSNEGRNLNDNVRFTAGN
ncbi:tetratricopeptide (TPR) repeat protein [Haloferula luteola]|uniref:Tetratricopeptide (TPR) repeat protein n=1 Tax=Haloferula luteola TaxID=595692 RepID=A0A840UZ51_9BACT|nr:right-handed parallel beta-helix repeat-containing protein [Haloferula luteola]MBB5350106.1 tetratricopeptide (TPR) repeat protein [Haloferula luteola]